MQRNKPWLAYVLQMVEPGDSAGGGGATAVAPPSVVAPAVSASDAGFTKADIDKAVSAALAEAARAGQAEQDELREKAARLDQIEEANRTAEERAAADLAKAKKDAETAKAEAVRYKAAAAAGIDPDSDDFALIGAGPEAEVMSRAKRVGELLAASLELEALKTQQQRPTNRPKPVLRSGAAPVDESTRVASMDAAHEAALRRGRVVPAK